MSRSTSVPNAARRPERDPLETRQVRAAIAGALALVGMSACGDDRPGSPTAPTSPGSAVVTASITSNPVQATPAPGGLATDFQARVETVFLESAGVPARITGIVTTFLAMPGGHTSTGTTAVGLAVPGGGSTTHVLLLTFSAPAGTSVVLRLTASGVDDRGSALIVPPAEVPVRLGSLPAPPMMPGAVEGVLAGAADISTCRNTNDSQTAALLDGLGGIVFTAGDHAYEDGTTLEFEQCYEPTWGRHRGRTRPSPGNHDYHTPGAGPYYAYFGGNAGPPGLGYYSYDIGSWHILSLNSNVRYINHAAQLSWLQSDLAGRTNSCMVAYWHHPAFSSGGHGDSDRMKEVWRILYAAGVDVIVNGHDHNYERFALQDPDARLDPARGIRQFVAGTGGRSLRGFQTIHPNSEVRDSSTYGVLVLTLRVGGYDWEFVPVAGGSFRDAGSGACSPATAAWPAPSFASDLSRAAGSFAAPFGLTDAGFTRPWRASR